jgi:hypothetical protein
MMINEKEMYLKLHDWHITYDPEDANGTCYGPPFDKEYIMNGSRLLLTHDLDTAMLHQKYYEVMPTTDEKEFYLMMCGWVKTNNLEVPWINPITDYQYSLTMAFWIQKGMDGHNK